jgi:hypothetical protein
MLTSAQSSAIAGPTFAKVLFIFHLFIICFFLFNFFIVFNIDHKAIERYW